MMAQILISILLVAHSICMLAKKSEGSFLHFYSHSDACNMKQRDRNLACKKFLQQRSDGGNVRGMENLEDFKAAKVSVK
ncbi:hypothetical protein XENTR_v10005565 [Xenopus tropicalis]|nr:hypothetical protein XENTR_v10005565 [Xenopus tropicalis]